MSDIYQYHYTSGYAWFFTIIVFLLFIRSWSATPAGDKSIPIVGKRSKYEPWGWVPFRFFYEAEPILSDAYNKFGKSSFRFVQSDAERVVISNRYVEEIRSLSPEIASATQANVKNLVGKFSTTDALLKSDLQNRVLQSKLTPNLGNLVFPMKDEIEHAIATGFPECKRKRTALKVYPTCLELVAQVSATIFVGFPLCRNKQWIDLSIRYTENVFRTAMVLRLFPHWLQPLISFFTPYAWFVRQDLRIAHNLFIPIINERKTAQANDNTSYEKPHDFLQWMLDLADVREVQSHEIAHSQLLVTLAAIHTSTMAVIHVLLDLCERPEYIPTLRDEILEVLEEDGGWQKGSPSKLQKLDSFMKESQRFSPPSLRMSSSPVPFPSGIQRKNHDIIITIAIILVTVNRVAMRDLTLSDGLFLPRGTRFCMASAHTLNDPEVTPNPEIFDGFRHHTKRQQAPGEAMHHQFATTDKSNLHFGIGKYACPGRFFASQEIKMIVAHILLRYRIQFIPGQGRPKNRSAFEYIFPDPEALIWCQERIDDVPLEIDAE